jgi:phage nucleotide-binding protein
MAINIKSTKDFHSNGVKILVYGHSGAGKTALSVSLPNPFIISAEGGLLSIADADINYAEVKSMDDVMEIYEWVTSSNEAKQYESIALDSISEIGEVVLNHEKKINKDPRAAYGAMQEQLAEIIRAFRDINGKHVYFTAKCEKSADEQGRILYSPSMPGNKAGQSLPYFFDEVLALRVELDAEKNPVRALMTSSDGLWQAKDRSGMLSAWEHPDLGDIIKKIRGEK